MLKKSVKRMVKSKFLFVLVVGIILVSLIASFVLGVEDLLNIQGNVQQAGVDLAQGNVTFYIYDAYVLGTLVYSGSFNNTISNGKYDIVLGNSSTNELSLNYGQNYFLEMAVDGENFTFDGAARQIFQSSVGNVSFSNIHGSMNIVMTNRSTTIDSGLNVTTGAGGWFKGLFNWTTDSYFTFTGATLSASSTLSQWLYNQTAAALTNYGANWSNHSATLYTNYGSLWYNQTLATKTNYGANWSNDTATLSTLYKTLWYNHSLNTAWGDVTGKPQIIVNDSNANLTSLKVDGGWTNSGVTIDNGAIWAQILYTYNLTSLGVTNLNVNGSIIPNFGNNNSFNNTFDIGQANRTWNDAWFGGDMNIDGGLNLGNGTGSGAGSINLSGILNFNAGEQIYHSPTSSALAIVGFGTFPNRIVDIWDDVRLRAAGGSLNVSGDTTVLSLNTGNATGASAGEIKTSGDIIIDEQGNLMMNQGEYIFWKDAAGTHRSTISVVVGDDVSIGNTNFDDVILKVGTLGNAFWIKDATGNVGIGTDTPSQKLEVSGNLEVAGINASQGLNVGTATGAGAGDIQLSGNQTFATGMGILFVDGNTLIKEVSDDLFITADDDMALQPDDDLLVYVGGTSYAIFDGGNERFGIGTTAPNYKLEVEKQGNNLTLAPILSIKQTNNSLRSGAIVGEIKFTTPHGAQEDTAAAIRVLMGGDQFWNRQPGQMDFLTTAFGTSVQPKTRLNISKEGLINIPGGGNLTVGTDITVAGGINVGTATGAGAGDIKLSGNQTFAVGMGVQFTDGNTAIYEKAADDLYIDADDDMFLRPDDDLLVYVGGTSYAIFDGGNQRLNLTSGDLYVEGGEAQIYGSDPTNLKVGIDDTQEGNVYLYSGGSGTSKAPWIQWENAPDYDTNLDRWFIGPDWNTGDFRFWGRKGGSDYNFMTVKVGTEPNVTISNYLTVTDGLNVGSATPAGAGNVNISGSYRGGNLQLWQDTDHDIRGTSDSVNTNFFEVGGSSDTAFRVNIGTGGELVAAYAPFVTNNNATFGSVSLSGLGAGDVAIADDTFIEGGLNVGSATGADTGDINASAELNVGDHLFNQSGYWLGSSARAGTVFKVRTTYNAATPSSPQIVFEEGADPYGTTDFILINNSESNLGGGQDDKAVLKINYDGNVAAGCDDATLLDLVATGTISDHDFHALSVRTTDKGTVNAWIKPAGDGYFAGQLNVTNGIYVGGTTTTGIINAGIYANGSAGTIANNYAGYFVSTVANMGTNYGIYAQADGGAIDYAAYFAGDTLVEDDDKSYFGDGKDGEIYYDSGTDRLVIRMT